MDGLNCNFTKIADIYLGNIIDANSAGIVEFSTLMYHAKGTYWLNGVDFTHFFSNKALATAAKVQEDCTTHPNCMHADASYYWMGKKRIPGKYKCPRGKLCSKTIKYENKTWVSSQTSHYSRRKPNLYSDVFNVRYNSTSPLSITYSFYGPSETNIYFNEVRLLVQMALVKKPGNIISPKSAQRVCSISPEGLFSFSFTRYQK
ncbi:hypothetical protein DSO57_1018799 [Entomophthora muscae]|uniref:Uncharacterized protein n=1 Tax=Entomophthora muscae TaxID=34485 RepID=A0ACC2T422_9FUNG|nr:hypothetical protein DSO57_1018799 [Entomophthora muscae]